MLKKILLLLFSGVLVQADAQEMHQVELTDPPAFIENNHFKQGSNRSPKGAVLDLNNYYLRINGKAVLPVMGEMHYSRYPRAEWEEALLKMKAAGIQVVAFYDFWSHHEEDENHFRFDENRDVRYFIELCQKHGLYAVARLGPWAHGEARNGGFPEWFLKKQESGNDRVSKNGNIEPEVKRWYAQLAAQFKGLYYKDGGPLIGVQLDNEVSSNGPSSWGFQYMAALKKLAVSCGMDVPLYVVTGWPGPQVPEDEVLPLWGGYADAPWTQNTKPLAANKLYTFVTDRKDKNIGNDQLKYQPESPQIPFYRHPYLTVELGGGIQNTYHRRPVLQGKDLLALVYTRLGVGANMLGYYVFQGAQHPLSWHETYSTEESKSSVFPYPNDYPKISYDFQAPITEWGFLRESYHDFKLLHQFVNSYGETLAPMTAMVPADNPKSETDLQTLRYAVRSKGGSGFLFFNNYARHQELADHPNVVFNIKTGSENIRIPQQGSVHIPGNTYGLLPFNYEINGVKLQYATAHPTAILNTTEKTYCYYAMEGMVPEFRFESRNVRKVVVNEASVIRQNGYILIQKLRPGKNCFFRIIPKNGRPFKILLLNREEAGNSYTFKIKGQETLLLTPNMAFFDAVNEALTIRSLRDPAFDFYTFPAIQTDAKAAGKSGLFSRYAIHLPEIKPSEVTFKQVSADKNMLSYNQSLAGKTPSGPTYNIFYNRNLPYKTYEINLPATLPKGLHDVLISFNYQGNTAALYDQGKIVADDFYAGLPMNYSLKRHQDDLKTNRFLFQITPLMEKADVWFEPGTPLDFSKTNPASLNKISVIPEYEVILKLK